MEKKQLAVVGTREVNDKIRRDMEQFVGQKCANSYGIITGGATGADDEALRIALQLGLAPQEIHVYLPTELACYCAALLKRAQLGKCRAQDAQETVSRLQAVAHDHTATIYDDTPFTSVDAVSFHFRNRKIVEAADELVAFRVAKSAGTTYTVEQARAKGMPVTVFDYDTL